MRKLWMVLFVFLLVSGMLAFGEGKKESGKGYVIGFSNSYGGNTYRQTMEALFKKLADKMVADGTLKSYKMLQSNNNVATQVSQIESLILEGVNAIIIDPGSGSGLNGAIERATKAGIPVVIVNDGPITSDLAYQINWDTDAMASNAAKSPGRAIGNKGTIIEIRGMAGVPFDEAFHTFGRQHIKASRTSRSSGRSTASGRNPSRSSRSPRSSPASRSVDGVCDPGGDEYGALLAFQAAGRKIPDHHRRKPGQLPEVVVRGEGEERLQDLLVGGESLERRLGIVCRGRHPEGRVRAEAHDHAGVERHAGDGG